jgi:hypothetical protein
MYFCRSTVMLLLLLCLEAWIHVTVMFRKSWRWHSRGFGSFSLWPVWSVSCIEFCFWIEKMKSCWGHAVTDYQERMFNLWVSSLCLLGHFSVQSHAVLFRHIHWHKNIFENHPPILYSKNTIEFNLMMICRNKVMFVTIGVPTQARKSATSQFVLFHVAGVTFLSA